ncbi:hypothetical protein [Cohnella thailandensis]|uniref:Uncharacterized protein n=1 Tax=Cohnella thailandensis TaxID=557557 RepID=A0A841SVP9_9BACL|nr:hypothetical protein [Cohnella thailandensis]MBB6632781.1 hypothetical protein [Cohnella thailandensis]MBP1975529.1 hypothetical protein [Cohnella thailandensis]
MDYKAFFADVERWIQAANQAAMQHGMESAAFWQWVADSAGALCRKYGEHRLAILQMMMMVEWLEEVYDKRKAG